METYVILSSQVFFSVLTPVIHKGSTLRVTKPSLNKSVSVTWDNSQAAQRGVVIPDILHLYTCTHLGFVSLGDLFQWASKVKIKDELSPNGGICVYKEIRMGEKFALC